MEVYINKRISKRVWYSVELKHFNVAEFDYVRMLQKDSNGLQITLIVA